MDKELRTKLDELYKLLDNVPCIKNIEKIKNDIPADLVFLIDEYRLTKNAVIKKHLYQNDVFCQYIENETALNFLIFKINNLFKESRHCCENNKW